MTIPINKRIVSVILAIMLLATITLPGITYAQGNSGEKRAQIAEKVEARKEKARASLEEKLAEREAKQAERLQERCEKQVAKIHEIMQRLSGQANRHLGVMDSFYERVKGFYDKGQLTVGNYVELTANVDEAKAAAETEVAALQEQTVEIDCSDPETIVDVRAYRNGVGTVKSSLKDYRKSLVALISAMRSAAAEEKADSEGSDDDLENATESESELETENENESESESENETETENTETQR